MVERGGAPRSSRWLARASLAGAAAAVAVPAAFAGLRTFGLLLVGLIGTGAAVAAVWWILTRRGVLRVLSVALALAAPAWVLLAYTRAHLTWVVAVSGALWLVAIGTGRAALARREASASAPSTASTASAAPAASTRQPAPMAERPAAESRHPFLIMNPRSGGGKVNRFALREKAEALGAEVLLLEGPVEIDVAEAARKAAAAGADLLGVAGGDGTQALVADVAASLGLPFLVIPAGTRNHFALDLGLDRDDPSKALDALRDGVELHVDLGRAAGRPFVNNVSFGAYAEVVQSPAYRDGKTRTTLELLPDLLLGHEGARLTARAGAHIFSAPQALLVSNNPYGTGDVAGLGRRARLDSGELGCVGVNITSAARAAALVAGRRSSGMTRTTATDVLVEADQEWIPVGVDGEALRLRVPVRIEVRPLALRVLVPRRRPGVRRVRPPIDWRLLGQLAYRGAP